MSSTHLEKAVTPPHQSAKNLHPSLSVLRERLVLWMWKHGWASRPL